MKKAFTLIELLIVICILGILTFVLFSAYKKVSEISFRIEQQRKINEELLLMSEILQNFANRNSIDFGKYVGDESLINQEGFSYNLYLSWEDWQLKIYATWNCVEYWKIPESSNLEGWCAFYLEKDGHSPIKLTNDSVYFTRAKFKIIPYSDQYFSSSNDLCQTNYLACINDVWFWLFTDIYPRAYNESIWSNNIHVLVQHFFNI